MCASDSKRRAPEGTVAWRIVYPRERKRQRHPWPDPHVAFPARCAPLRQSDHAAVATRLPTFAILTHRGRKSGRAYRTPINVFRRGDHYFFFLTYGSDVQWVKNILATGSCSIETRGRVVELVEPELVTDPELRPAPPHVRFVERRIAGVTQYLRMRASSST